MSQSQPTRRQVLRHGAAVVATSSWLRHPLRASRRSSVNESLGLGLIGAGGMGSANLRACLNHPAVRLVAVCDVQADRRQSWTEGRSEVRSYLDHRELLADPRVDAVIIATPPHWHCIQAVDAAEAGKHIYLQKPMALYPAESLVIAEAVRRHGVVSQVGTQIHQADNYRRVVDWVRSGKLGPIGRIETFWGWNMGPNGIGTAPREQAPERIDFDRWCGPAPLIPFNRLLVHDAAKHCSWMDYSGGWSPGMAPHLIDLPVWALQLGFPERVSAMGGRYMVGGDGDAPDTQDFLWQYPGRTMRWHFSQFNHHAYEFGSGVRKLGIYFHGLHGTLRCDYGQHEIIPQNEGLDPDDPPARRIPPGGVHEHEWIDAILHGGRPSCDAAYHLKVDLPLSLANLSYRLQRSLRIDPATGAILGDPAAAAAAVPQYRAPWKFPEQYLKQQ